MKWIASEKQLVRPVRSRKIAVRITLVFLSFALWKLGKVPRSHWISTSPDGRFSVSLVFNRGWNSFDLKGRYLLYLTDSQTHESVVGSAPAYILWVRENSAQ